MIFMSKEMNKKTGLTKLEKENLDNVNAGYTIEVFNDGTVVVSGIPRPGARLRGTRPTIQPINGPAQPRVFRTFNNQLHALSWAKRNLLPDQLQRFVAQPMPPQGQN